MQRACYPAKASIVVELLVPAQRRLRRLALIGGGVLAPLANHDARALQITGVRPVNETSRPPTARRLSSVMSSSRGEPRGRGAQRTSIARVGEIGMLSFVSQLR